MHNGVPSQYVDAPVPREYEQVDLQEDFPAPDQASLHDPVQEFLDRKIDRFLAPVFDARVFNFTDGVHLLVISLDHIVTDAISNEILKQELQVTYKLAVGAVRRRLPEIPLHFADYAMWLSERFPAWYRLHAAYWQEKLAGVSIVSWPESCKGPADKLGQWETLRFSLGDQLTAQLIRFAKNEQTFPALVMLASYVAAIAQWCNQSDVALAFVENGRWRAELVRMVGCLATLLHFRIKLDEAITYHSLIALLKQEYDSADRHRDFDWAPSIVPDFRTDLIFNWLPVASTGGKPLVSGSPGAGHCDQEEENAMVPYPAYPSRSAVGDIAAASPYRLGLACFCTSIECTASLFYKADILTMDAASRFARHLRMIIETVIHRPSMSIWHESP